MDIATLEIELALDRVGQGGNTARGQYFYSFDPADVHVTATPTLLVYTLSDNVDKSITLDQVFTTDSQSQLQKIVFSENRRSVSMLHANTRSTLILVSMMAIDTSHSMRINCDPQITNAPGNMGG